MTRNLPTMPPMLDLKAINEPLAGLLARELEGAEREAMWEHLVRFNPQYQRYQDGTERRLPVMLLSRED